MTKEDDFWEKCKKCKFFDGYDMCLINWNFGAVTNEKKSFCETNNLFKEKEEIKYNKRYQEIFNEGCNQGFYIGFATAIIGFLFGIIATIFI